MPATNECIDWAGVRARVAAAELMWLTSDPGTGTLPGNRVNTAGEVWSYVKTNAANPFLSNRVLDWSQLTTYRLLKASQYAARFASVSGAPLQTSGFSFTSTSWCLEAWVRWQSGYTGSIISVAKQVGLGNGFAIQLDGSGVLVGEVGLAGGGTTTFNDSGGARAANTWYHLAIERNGDAANMNGLHVNGGRVAQFTFGFDSILTNVLLSFARGFDPSSGNPTGSGTVDIDDVRLWNIGRSGATIAAQNQSVLSPSTTGLVEYFKFENNTTATTGTGIGTGTAPSSYVTDTAF